MKCGTTTHARPELSTIRQHFFFLCHPSTEDALDHVQSCMTCVEPMASAGNRLSSFETRVSSSPQVSKHHHSAEPWPAHLK